MPELAEVEYYRKQWNRGIDETLVRVQLHGETRIFRGIRAKKLRQLLPGSALLRSEANGKQLLFEFSEGLWLGLHLGMTGKLTEAPPGFRPGKHDHLVLFSRKRALIFNDPRQFGRVRFGQGSEAPEWWNRLPAPVNSTRFTRAAMEAFLRRHARLPLKGALLHQTGFPGIGNWMADEILWRAKLNPLTRPSELVSRQTAALWRSLRFVCRGALRHISPNFADPPSGWLFHQRWKSGGLCPIHAQPLERRTVAGRTTAWCSVCQRAHR